MLGRAIGEERRETCAPKSVTAAVVPGAGVKFRRGSLAAAVNQQQLSGQLGMLAKSKSWTKLETCDDSLFLAHLSFLPLTSTHTAVARPFSYLRHQAHPAPRTQPQHPRPTPLP